MQTTLTSLCGDYRSLSIIGMCKNAGKTTALNRMIGEYDRRGVVLGLTSIGRDGESRDVVTSTHKPRIYIRRGTLFATAAGLLPLCDMTREVLKTTGIATPLGEVVLFRALSDGYVQLAGPSMNRQLMEVRGLFEDYGAEKIIIDGAISRRSLCSRAVTEATVLCTGASCHKDLDTVVAMTKHICEILCLPELEDRALAELLEQSGDKLRFFTEARESVLQSAEDVDESALLKRRADIRYLAVSGAVTDAVISPLILSGVPLEGLTLVAEDASKVLVSEDWLARFLRRGGLFAVRDAVSLRAVTVNPVSVYGYRFDQAEFKEKMTAALSVPVIDVKEDETCSN